MRGKILAIDPGNIESGYVVVGHNGKEITCVIEKGKVDNECIFGAIFQHCAFYETDIETELAVEMIASYGMAVGKSVFDTCVWIGRFVECAVRYGYTNIEYIYRKDEKTTLCNSMKAKDANIRQALIDRYAPNTPNGGKGTKKNPGFFYGFKADIWSAMAVAVTYFDMYVKNRTERE